MSGVVEEVPGEEEEVAVRTKLEDQGVEVEIGGDKTTLSTPPHKKTNTPSTRPQGMLTYLHSRPVGATGPMAVQLIIVRSLQHVPGKMCGFRNLICNEIPTNSTKKMTTILSKICYTEVKQK